MKNKNIASTKNIMTIVERITPFLSIKKGEYIKKAIIDALKNDVSFFNELMPEEVQYITKSIKEIEEENNRLIQNKRKKIIKMNSIEDKFY